MAVFPSFKLTKKGEELLNKSIGERKTLTFTKFEIGDGEPPRDFREQVGLVNKFYQFPILNTAVQKDQVLRIRGYFDNKSFVADKQLKEVGVYVKIDGDMTEYLYSYTNAGDTGDIIPAATRGFYSRTLDVANYIGYATNITFNIEQLRDRYAFNTENEMKVATYLKAGDKVELWGNLVLGDKPVDEYIVQEETADVTLNNGLFAKKISFNYVVKNIEELKKLNLKENDVIEVLGYYAVGDGAGHKRIINNEDDGSGVQLNNSKWANIVHNGEINVTWFGARGDGATDDTKAIQKALDYNCITDGNNKKYKLTQNINIQNSIKNFEIIVTRDFTFEATFSPYMYDAIITNKTPLKNIFLKNISCSCNFLGNENIKKDIENEENYTSPTRTFVNIMNSDKISVSGCYVHGFKCFSFGFDGSYNINFENNNIGTSMYHGIGIQGSLSSCTKNSTFKYNTVTNVGMLGFDANTLDNCYSYFYKNTIKNACGIAKTTTGITVSKDNFIECWNEDIPEDMGGIYGNAKKTIANNDIIMNGSVLFSSSNVLANNIMWQTKFCKRCVAIRDNAQIILKNMWIKANCISSATQFIMMSQEYTNANFFVSFHSNNFTLDTTRLRNDNIGCVIPSGNYSGFIKLQLDYFEHKSLRNHRFNMCSNPQVEISNSYIKNEGGEPQTYFSFKNARNTVIHNNRFENIAPLFYEDEVSSDFIQYNNFSSIKSTVSVGEATRVVDYNLKRAIAKNEKGLEEGGIYNKNGTVAIAGTLSVLNTPTMLYAMRMEDPKIETDFLNYSIEKMAYDKEMSEKEKAKMLAYEEALKENPALTWEEFEEQNKPRRVRRSLVLEPQEPQIPESVQNFINKYL